ncbi:kinetochore protein mis14 [Apiospora kogelbergensis]|uniref:kinetochore protein mis14 n=1 Tax=Apiospora kogelbergensis TaxID=1337665 RepID=UPI0031327CDB
MDTAVSAHQRKIELQAPEDLAFLLSNVRLEGAQGEDELRTRIEALISEYIQKTFELAAPNLAINGMPVDPSQLSSTATYSASGNPLEPEVVYAPFDARKRARVEELTREEEDLLRDIAHLKKTVPGAAATAWVTGVQAGIKADEEALEALKAADEQAQASASAAAAGDEPQQQKKRKRKQRDGAEEVGLRVEGLERQAEVERRYGEAVAGLERLKKEMPSIVAKMERARGAGGYVVTER